MQIATLQHVPFEGPAAIAEWADSRQHLLTVTRLFEDDAFPALAAFDWLVVMGGPMGVHDQAQYPWLIPEQDFIREAIEAGKTVIGICLGAQLIASALGARVYRNPAPEIGWLPISLTEAGRANPLLAGLEGTLEVFHWHGDTFELPADAVHLMRSATCEHQGFLFDNRVLALQCHLESTRQSVEHIVLHCAEEIGVDCPTVQKAERMLAATDDDYARIHAALFDLLDRLAAQTGR